MRPLRWHLKNHWQIVISAVSSVGMTLFFNHMLLRDLANRELAIIIVAILSAVVAFAICLQWNVFQMYKDMRSTSYLGYGTMQEVFRLQGLSASGNPTRKPVTKKAAAYKFLVVSAVRTGEPLRAPVAVSYHEFLNYIEHLAMDTRGMIYGTSTLGRPSRLKADKDSCRYLKKLMGHQARNFIRVTVLDSKDISGIIKDALEGLEAQEDGVTTETVFDLPELVWWAEEANGCSYSQPFYPDFETVRAGGQRAVLWTTHIIARDQKYNERHLFKRTGHSDDRVADFALFDDEVLVTYSSARQNTNGIMRMVCGGDEVYEVTSGCELIRRALEGDTDIDLADLGLASSFKGLLDEFPNGVPKSIPIGNYVSLLGVSEAPNLRLPTAVVYSKIIEALNNDRVRFSSDYRRAWQHENSDQ